MQMLWRDTLNFGQEIRIRGKLQDRARTRVSCELRLEGFVGVGTQLRWFFRAQLRRLVARP